MATELRGNVLTALFVLPSLIVTLWLLMERTDGWIAKFPLPSNSLTFCMLACGVSWETFSLMATLATYWGQSREQWRVSKTSTIAQYNFPFPFHFPLTWTGKLVCAPASPLILPLNEVCVKISSASNELCRLLIAWETGDYACFKTLSVKDD